MHLIFERSRPGRRAITLDPLDVPPATLPPELCRAQDADLPEVSEFNVVRHFTHLSQRNVGVDDRFYPLGSCTMKYNPKMAETVAANPGLMNLHPHTSSTNAYHNACQGAYELIYELEKLLAEIELAISKKAPNETLNIPAYALYYVCENAGGVCYYLRQDFNIALQIDDNAPALR